MVMTHAMEVPAVIQGLLKNLPLNHLQNLPLSLRLNHLQYHLHPVVGLVIVTRFLKIPVVAINHLNHPVKGVGVVEEEVVVV
jgi:hypothetical protein